MGRCGFPRGIPAFTALGSRSPWVLACLGARNTRVRWSQQMVTTRRGRGNRGRELRRTAGSGRSKNTYVEAKCPTVEHGTLLDPKTPKCSSSAGPLARLSVSSIACISLVRIMPLRPIMRALPRAVLKPYAPPSPTFSPAGSSPAGLAIYQFTLSKTAARVTAWAPPAI